MIDAEPAALDHRRAAHADRSILGRDDDVAAAEHRGVAGEATARDDANQRHETGELCELHEGRAVEASDAEPVGIAGPPAAALGVEHQRHPPMSASAEHAVDLPVVHVALSAGEHRVVVGERHAARASAPKYSPFTVPKPVIRPSAGVFLIRSSSSRRRRCAAIASAPYSTNEPGSTAARGSRAPCAGWSCGGGRPRPRGSRPA